MLSTSSPSLFRKRDIGILIIVLISIYLCYFDVPSLNYVIEPAWFIDQNELIPSLESIKYKLIPPIITDLEGDGVNELILVTNDFKIKKFSANIPSMGMTDIYHPEEISSIDLSQYLSKSSKTVSTPVALKTGYIEPYKASESRSQAIIIVFDDLTVVCFDSFLHHKWDKKIAHHTLNLDWNINKYRINEVSLYVAPLQINENNSNGVVIVGASWIKRNDDNDNLDSSFLKNDLNSGIINDSFISNEHEERMIESKLSHFSVYALDSLTGHIIWIHDGQEIRTEQYSKSLPQHAYSLDVKDLMAKIHHAPGINDWTVFRRSLIDELPHNWYGVEHTSMRIAHFIRRHVGAGQQLQKPNNVKAHYKTTTKKKKVHDEITSGKGRNGKQATRLGSLPLLQGEIKTTGLEATATLPHNAEEHTTNPNVVVIHTKHGLEIIALRTGIPITSLALAPDRVYADVDGDGVVDAIVILDNPERVRHHESEYIHHQYEFSNVKLQHCMLVVMSGLPSQSQLFNGSVCLDRPSLHDSLKHHSPHHEDSKYWNSKITISPRLIPGGDDYPEIVHTIPLILHKMNPNTEKESKIRDIIVSTHNGVVTSYSGTGNFNWQVRSGPKWSKATATSTNDIDNSQDIENKQVLTEGSIQAYDSDAIRVNRIGYHNNMHTNILLSGESTVQLLSRDGDELANAEIPRPPISQPILGDFDNDGITDIIVVTEGAILGYHVHIVQANPVVLILLIILSILAIFVFILNIQTISSAILDETRHSSTTNKPSQVPSTSFHHRKVSINKAYTFFHIMRSTDEQHLD